MTVHVPLWLVAVTEALVGVPDNHPHAVSVLSAVLITMGSLPIDAIFGVPAAGVLAEVAQGLGLALRETIHDGSKT